ncbi:hypothetical protein [Streptomyces sp. NPDC088812]|uniref:hypothetical protein n=1 Tax=Streptomyces sp. NPDC088812 TaxID=3365905 RepID=UPI003814A085
MSARDWLYARLTGALIDPDRASAELDNYRTEVIAKAVGRLRAIPVQCTALTGPVWYGAGWRDAITCLEDIADYQTPDDEAYPGELQRLRAHALAMRVAARKVVMGDVQRIALDHAVEDANARDNAKAGAPDFFQPGRTYASGDDDWRFRCDAVTTHPDDGERTALGWRHFRGEWEEYAYYEDDWDAHQFHGHIDVTEAGETQ